MDEITSKEKILKAIRNGLMNKKDNPFSSVNTDKAVLQSMEESIDLQFAQELSKLGGKFIFCENENDLPETLSWLLQEEKIGPLFCVNPELQEQLNNAGIEYLSKEEDLKKAKSGITSCEFLVARFGSVLMSSGLSSGRKLYSWPEIHLVVAYASQLVPEISDAIIGMREKYNGVLPSMITLVSGPSRTADIEKTLVLGAHGPRELFVFFIDDLIE
ncbi:MAG: hypothetical protein GQ527_01860 [Bacteroidales bacterium]|nr:hypothetical protein [Bacteroidales bacterium]